MPGSGPVVWLTGLSGSGKTTLAHEVATRLRAAGRWVCILDGDELRAGVSRDLGFSPAERSEHLRRVAEIARLIAHSGAVVLVATISPAAVDRAAARRMAAGLQFLEVHLDVPLAVCAARDPKGLYRRARSGQLTKLTGVDAPYDVPAAPDLRIGVDCSPAEAAEIIIAALINGDHIEST